MTMPDRDTVDAVVLFDLAITLLAKTDMYPERIVGQVVTWLRERTRCSSDEDYAHACELATLLERMQQPGR